jgi:hypothetical protein
VTDPAQMPVREARPRSLKSPRWSAERRASRVISAFTRVLTRYGTQGASLGAWRAAIWHAERVPLHPNVSRRSATPRSGPGEAKMQSPGADMRRGNEMGCLTSE